MGPIAAGSCKPACRVPLPSPWAHRIRSSLIPQRTTQTYTQAWTPTDGRPNMQRYGLGIVVVGWLLVEIALAAEQCSLAVPGTVCEAPRVFVRYCNACHGMEGRGNGPAATALQPPPADLTRIAQRRDGLFPVAEVTAVIDGRTIIPAHGSREMPIWGERFGEGAPLSWHPSADAVAGRWPGVVRPAKPSSTRCSVCSSTTFRPSSANATQFCSAPPRA